MVFGLHGDSHPDLALLVRENSGSPELRDVASFPPSPCTGHCCRRKALIHPLEGRKDHSEIRLKSMSRGGEKIEAYGSINLQRIYPKSLQGLSLTDLSLFLFSGNIYYIFSRLETPQLMN